MEQTKKWRRRKNSKTFLALPYEATIGLFTEQQKHSQMTE